MPGASSAWEPIRFSHRRFHRIADLIGRLAGERDWPAVATLNACFAGELGAVGVRLVEAPKTKPTSRPDGTIDPASLYEVRIVERGEVSTRPRNAHDLLNAIVWAAFPQSKLALTRALASVQRERAKGRARLPATRTPAHDRLAMIDEGALLCVTSSRGSSVWIFGHAIYEHAYASVFSVRGAAVDLVVESDVADLVAGRAAVDRAFAAADWSTAMRRGPGLPLDGDT